MSTRAHHRAMPPTTILAPDLEASAPERAAAASQLPVAEATPSEVEQPAMAAEARDVAPVIRSKIEPPQLRSTTLSRGRLLERLNVAIARRVTLLIAEAGYGKTTLLTDFSSRPFARCLWYKLDSTDQDWVTLVNYVVAAARELEPTFGQRTIAMLTGDPTSIPPRDAVVGSLIAELQALADSDVVLILDDFHAIDESSEACELVLRLIRDAPPSFRFILASRRHPPPMLARLASMGELSEIGTDELRFSLDEIERLFAEAYGRPLARDVVQEIDARTRGWAATLQLLNSSIRGRSDSAVRSLARAISGGEGRLYDFLAHEVLARLPAALHDFVVRAALLQEIRPEYVVPLFPAATRPRIEVAAAWIEEADRIGILSRSSESSAVRQFHPLFREFLMRQLAEQLSTDEVKAAHGRVARTAVALDPLVAAHHFIEASEGQQAMHCLAASAMLTMGSGRWGAASELIGRLHDVPPDPVIAAIQARRLLEDGDVVAAAAMLAGVDVSAEPPAVRAVFRHTQLSLGWRSRDSEAVFATLREIQADEETPLPLREIAQVFVDASPLSPTPVSFPALSQRLQRMAERQARAGHSYYAAISLHNAAIAEMNAGRFQEAMRVASLALDAFDSLGQANAESYGTHALMAACALELGLTEQADEEMRIALATGRERGDVHADCAYALAATGESERARRLLITADAMERQGRSDLAGAVVSGLTRAVLLMESDPAASQGLLEALSTRMPLDVGFDLERRMLLALAMLLRGARATALREAQAALEHARRQGAARVEGRLLLIIALARESPTQLSQAIAHANSSGGLALLQVADAIGQSLTLVPEVPPDLANSIAKWTGRWLPILRRQMAAGDTANAFAAARLLDDHGTLEDIGRLRAYEKTYARRARGSGLGRALARRVSPRLEVQDLGRVTLRVGERLVPLTRVRRKPASLLMYLVTRPNGTAQREQILEDLWPDTDPSSASNSLNQSLYFLRREIDPWYEDDVSADYVAYESELLWLDSGLVRVASIEFVADVRRSMSQHFNSADAIALLERYGGPFCPEFEYEEWAMTWRSRAHSAFLSFAHTAAAQLIERVDIRGARDVALQVLSVDPTAADLERVLIWTYWRLGNTSAASAQYQHLAAQESADGLDSIPLSELVSAPRPVSG
jgi:DNA-binding SARP family transcriptional activator